VKYSLERHLTCRAASAGEISSIARRGGRVTVRIALKNPSGAFSATADRSGMVYPPMATGWQGLACIPCSGPFSLNAWRRIT
jgi:hypothetical protein